MLLGRNNKSYCITFPTDARQLLSLARRELGLIPSKIIDPEGSRVQLKSRDIFLSGLSAGLSPAQEVARPKWRV